MAESGQPALHLWRITVAGLFWRPDTVQFAVQGAAADLRPYPSPKRDGLVKTSTDNINVLASSPPRPMRHRR